MIGSIPMDRAARIAWALLLSAAAAGCVSARPTAPRAAPPAAETGAAPATSAASGPAIPPAPASAPGAAKAPAGAPRPKGRPGGLGAASSAALALVGAWRPLGGGPRVGDLPAVDRQVSGPDVVLEFKADGTWAIAGATYRARGTYRWLDAAELELATVESNLASQVGTLSRRRVDVDGTDLALTVETRGEGGRRLEDVVTRYRRVAGH